MKHYPKRYEDIFSINPKDTKPNKIGTRSGSIDELALKFRSFYKTVHPLIFDMMVKQTWLQMQFAYNGAPLNRTSNNGYAHDWAYGYFMKFIVGISQKPITLSFLFTTLTSYFADFFPDFLNHDPFLEPEYFKYPYKHVTLDFLIFVHMCDDRLEMLAEAEKREMKYVEFCNWVINQVLCYNDDIGEDRYAVTANQQGQPYIRDSSVGLRWNRKRLNLKSKKDESK